MDVKTRNIGVFCETKDYMVFAKEYILNHISKMDENIIREIYTKDKIKIYTNKSQYIILYPTENCRGYRWHDVFIFGNIDEELAMNIIYSKLIRDTDNYEWNYKEHIFRIETLV